MDDGIDDETLSMITSRRVSVQIGQKFGDWTVVAPTTPQNRRACIVVCVCGTKKAVRRDTLLNGTSQRCRQCATDRHRKRRGSDAPHWKGEDIGYEGVHVRLAKHLGTPDGPCAHCGTTDPDTLYQWAYDHLDPDERIDPIRGPYSIHEEHYTRMCTSCHRKLDTGTRGEKNFNSVLTADIVLECRLRRAAGESYNALAREFGVWPGTMRNAIIGRTWAWLEEAA